MESRKGLFLKDQNLQDLIVVSCQLPVNQNPSLTSHERVKIELATYLQSPKSDAESDPPLWWQSQDQNFPVLAVLAKKYLCICATSTSSERLFSTSGTIVTPKRSCLKPDMVNMLVFLSKNPNLCNVMYMYQYVLFV